MVSLSHYIHGSFIYGPHRFTTSRWGFVYTFENKVALYHSLTISIVLLTDKQFRQLQQYCVNDINICEVTDWIDELIDAELLVGGDEDNQLYQELRTKIPSPNISIMQLILAETCNLACKYCFIGRNSAEFDCERNECGTHLMSSSIADRALEYFERQISASSDPESPKDIIFYGGEPLLNFDILRHVVKRVRCDQHLGKIAKQVNFLLITNGTLLTKEIALFLKKEHVLMSLSVDGVDEGANDCRVDRAGHPAFQRIMEGIRLARTIGVDFGLSVTLTANTLSQRKSLLRFLVDNSIEYVSFNILLGANPPGYNEEAAKFIVDFYREARHFGIKEDRMLRKIKAFSQRRFYYHDCAALSGNQIVVMPDGNIGICQGQIGDKLSSISHVDEIDVDIGKLDVVRQWMLRSPINREQCADCSAIGICGGGCPINSKEVFGDMSHLDERFCVHTKKALEFLIGEICANMKGRGI